MFTALLIALLIVAGAGSALVGGWLLESQRRRALERGEGDEVRALGPGGSDAAPGAGRLIERGLGDPRPGDVIQYDGRDWLVEGVLLYDEDGHRWAGGRLVDVDTVRWLLVGLEQTGRLGPLLLADDPEIDVGGYPPDVLVAGERRYQLERRGTATVKLLGDAGALPGASRGLSPESVLRCRWWRYQAAGPDCIVVEQWGGDFRVLRGAAVPDGQIELMPGS